MSKGVCKEPVIPIKLQPKMTINELIVEFSKAGCFGAGRLARAVDIFERMLKEKALVVLGLSGAMTPAGMRQIIIDMIKEKMVDVIVTTGANMVHDTLEAFGGTHYKGSPCVSDNKLYNYRIDRIYDIFVPEELFKSKFDEPIWQTFRDIEEKCHGKTLSSMEFMQEIGKRIKNDKSIIATAYKQNVPIFVPAIQDSCIGLALWEYREKKGWKEGEQTVVIDAIKELQSFFEILKKAEKIGALLVGGGVPKNFAFQSAFKLGKPYDYAIQLTMDRPEPGGLSGATLEEAVSWGKVSERGNKVQVISDSTICLPILVAAVMERMLRV
ncbi:MAG: deoxyhypusine synthase [Candidatus Bathyarchaeota archaeon]